MNNIYHVSFPHLNLNLMINPIAFTIGFVQVHWYGIILALGFILGFGYVYRRAESFKVDRNKLVDVILSATAWGIVGARLYYVIFYPGDFYKVNPIKIFYISEGGIAIYGGVIGGILGGIISSYIKKVPILPVLDISSMGLMIGQAVGRWGNFVNQEAFGSFTDLPWGMMSEKTFNTTVHPCFLYESLWCLCGFIILHIYSKKRTFKQGNIFIFYIMWYSFGRLFIEKLRTDSLMIMDFKISQVISLIFMILVLVFSLFKRPQYT